jgi:hypothetical protein
MAADDRTRTTLAADQIDTQLKHTPELVGESRSAGRRILIVPPLTVTYRVLSDDRVVQVSHVQAFPPTKS